MFPGFRFLAVVVGGVAGWVGPYGDAWAEAPARPNIVLVMVDDMGYSDIGSYGGEIETPNLDALAANGLRFRRFYNTGRCCPTRASLLTGLHPHQAGIGHMTETPETPSPLEEEPYQGYLNDQSVTLAQALKRVGYHTLMSGKWHLGYHRKETWPLQRGFDRFFGILSGASHYFRPEGLRGLTRGNEPVAAPEDFYATDGFTDAAMEFIHEAVATDDRPFFLYLAYNAPHWPLQAKAEDLAKYEGRYAAGWEAVASARQARQEELGLLDPAWTPADHEGPVWSTLDDEQKRLQDLRMAAYAACVDSVDQNIGRLMARLKSLGVYENTVFFFLTDNGACAEGGVLGSGSERSVREPRLSQGTAGPRVGRVWANVSSTPFRLYKHYVHEGGMATPLIVHWPQGIPASRRGQWEDSFGYLPDFMPTLLELAGGSYPERWKGRPLPSLAGRSFAPWLRGNPTGPIHPEPVFWEHEGNRAMREGVWKLVWAGDGPWELFHLGRDGTESHDLSTEEPRRALRMRRQWESWARRTGVQFQASFSYYQMIRTYRDEGVVER